MASTAETIATVVNTGDMVIYLCVQLSVSSTKLLVDILGRSTRRHTKIRVRRRGNSIVVTSGRDKMLYFSENRVRFGGMFLERMGFAQGDTLAVSEVCVAGERGVLLRKIVCKN